jgi:hypothetical protein
MKTSHCFMLVACLAALALVPSAAEACMSSCECQVECPGLIYCGPCDDIPWEFCGVESVQVQKHKTFVEFLAADEVRLTLEGYSTTHLDPLNECLTAVPQLESVENLTEVVNHDGRTKLPFEEVTFVPSKEAGIVAGVLAYEHGEAGDNAPWFGFESRITGVVADGVPNSFTLDLKLKPGVSPTAFLRELRGEGTFVTGATGEHPHLFFRAFRNTDIFVEYPIPFAPKRHRVDDLPFDF